MMRWFRERRLIEETDRERRISRRRRLIVLAVLAFLLLDLIIAIGVILATTAPKDHRVGDSSSVAGMPMR